MGFTLHELHEAGDTMLVLHLRELSVYPPMKFKNSKQEEYYWRTVRDVKLTLPYAKLIAETLIETYEYAPLLLSDLSDSSDLSDRSDKTKIQKNDEKIWPLKKQCLTLQSQIRHSRFGSLAQLNRASDYGSEGYRFESCGSHTLISFHISSSSRLPSSTE